MKAVISGTGLQNPDQSISNAELVDSYNRFVEKFNAEHSAEIEAGDVAALETSSVEFIEKASGIKHRYVIDKQGILDVDRMRPMFETRDEDQVSIQAEIGVKAAQQAIEASGLRPDQIDGVMVAGAFLQRAYPGMAVEIQNELGIGGWAYDTNVGCATAVFGLSQAASMIQSGMSKAILIVTPEITSAGLNWERRDCHFIFGDVATALVVVAPELAEQAKGPTWEVTDVTLKTKFSNNIRSDAGPYNRVEATPREPWDLVFRQNGRKVFRDVVPMVSQLLSEQLERLEITPTDVKRYWLHQANRHMNDGICERVLGTKLDLLEAGRAPLVLDEYGNTSAAGCIIAFHKHQDGLAVGDKGLLSAFGAGYSIGSAVLEKRS